jgi:hypothetical protein
VRTGVLLDDLESAGDVGIDARLPGRLLSDAPNESWLTPEAISWTDEAVDEAWDVRFRLLLTVTEFEMLWLPMALVVRGLARGGDMGAGSLERAELTRSSSFCIFPIRPRI